MYVQLQVRLLSVLAAVLCSAIAACAQTVQEQLQQPAPLPVSSIPATLEQLPPNPPTLIYDNGLLIISARNSTLGDILRGIRDVTGAEIDVPPQAGERVVMRLGPGSPRDILRSLLAGSRFNYLIVGSDTDPNGLAKVMLFPKPAAENLPQSQVNAVPQPRLPLPESNIVTESVQQEDNSQDSAPDVRAQQRQMLQQRRQMVMQELQQNRQPD
jgi:hypothetical protein